LVSVLAPIFHFVELWTFPFQFLKPLVYVKVPITVSRL